VRVSCILISFREKVRKEWSPKYKEMTSNETHAHRNTYTYALTHTQLTHKTHRIFLGEHHNKADDHTLQVNVDSVPYPNSPRIF